MISLTPIHLLILALIVLLVAAGHGQIQRGLGRLRGNAGARAVRRPFFDGMNPATSLALAGAMLLALGLLVDVYGPDWAPVSLSEDVSLGLSGSGAILTLLSFYLDRRSRNRQG